MAIPGYQDFMLPLLKLGGDGKEHTPAEAVEGLFKAMRLSDEDRQEVLTSGGSRLANRIGWAIKYLKKAGLLRAVRKGLFQITDSGRQLLSTNPVVIDTNFLDTHFPEIREFLGRNPATDERRRRMAEIVRVAFRKLGGESDAQPVNPPWFMPGAEVVWQRIGATELALRGAVREAYVAVYGDKAAERILAGLSERDRELPERALRGRPVGADPLSVVDYLYLGQLPPLLFVSEVWQTARGRFVDPGSAKQRLSSAVEQIAPVRNAIAHVREVAPNTLMRAAVACDDVLAMLRGGSPDRRP